MQKLFILILTYCLPVFCLTNVDKAAGGGLDPTYGDGGKVITDFLGNAEISRHSAVQPDGKLLVVGNGSGSDVSERFGPFRYKLNGSVGEVPGFEWLTQVVVRVPPQLANAGSVQVRVTHGNTSNQGSIFIK